MTEVWHPAMLVALTVGFFVVAVLYGSVGHAGASGYLAVMSLLGVAPENMRPTSLAINILVATLVTVRFWRAGYGSWSGLWPFLIGSVPFAALGGSQSLALTPYRIAVGIVLALSAGQLLWRSGTTASADPKPLRINRLLAPIIGAVIGLASGLTGTGGGIFLSPVILFLGWGTPRQASGIAAPFILCNSIAALVTHSFVARNLPPNLPLLAGAALAGAAIGTGLGIRKFSMRGQMVALAAVMLLASVKLIFTR